MGSVPRINCLLAIVPIFLWVISQKINFFLQHDKLNKGVSITNKLPYTLKFVKPCSITSNSKAA